MSVHDDVMTQLERVIDPELGIDIVNLGLIYKLELNETNVHLTMTLTTPGCPLQPYFDQEIRRALALGAPGKVADITVTFDPPWTPEKMTETGKKHLALMR